MTFFKNHYFIVFSNVSEALNIKQIIETNKPSEDMHYFYTDSLKDSICKVTLNCTYASEEILFSIIKKMKQ